MMKEFEKELTNLINKHSIENIANMPDFLLSKMICEIIEVIGPNIKKSFNFQGYHIINKHSTTKV